MKATVVSGGYIDTCWLLGFWVTFLSKLWWVSLLKRTVIKDSYCPHSMYCIYWLSLTSFPYTISLPLSLPSFFYPCSFQLLSSIATSVGLQHSPNSCVFWGPSLLQCYIDHVAGLVKIDFQQVPKSAKHLWKVVHRTKGGWGGRGRLSSSDLIWVLLSFCTLHFLSAANLQMSQVTQAGVHCLRCFVFH